MSISRQELDRRFHEGVDNMGIELERLSEAAQARARYIGTRACRHDKDIALSPFLPEGVLKPEEVTPDNLLGGCTCESTDEEVKLTLYPPQELEKLDEATTSGGIKMVLFPLHQ